jgi:hypothetical protein
MNRRTLGIVLVIVAGIALPDFAVAQSPAQPDPKASALITKRIVATQEQVDTAKAQLDRNKREVEEVIEMIREKSVSDIGYEDVFRMLQIQKVELKVELEGLKARMDLLQKKIATDSDGDNELVDAKRNNLRRYVVNQEENLAKLNALAEKGAVPKSETVKAEQMLADAKLRLIEFESTSRQAAPKYVESLFETTLAIAERKAKLATVETMLAKYIETREDISKLKEAKGYQEVQRAVVYDLMEELNRLKRAKAEF